MRLYTAICALIESVAAHQQALAEDVRTAEAPERESDVSTQAEVTEGHQDRGMQMGFSRSEEDAFGDPIERKRRS